MLLAEDGLAKLVEQLRDMPAGDRRAILDRLSSSERTRVDMLIRRARRNARPAADAVPAAPPSPFSDAIAARIAAAHADEPPGMTRAAADALLDAAADVTGAESGSRAEAPAAAGSLIDSLAGLFRRGGTAR